MSCFFHSVTYHHALEGNVSHKPERIVSPVNISVLFIVLLSLKINKIFINEVFPRDIPKVTSRDNAVILALNYLTDCLS